MSRQSGSSHGFVVMLGVMFVSASLWSAVPASAQHAHTPAAPGTPVRLLDGLGRLHHPITTKSAEAQRFFDQGLTLVYGFNHDAAIRAFEEAARLDPATPMPYWGIALALGENINSPVDPERAARAYAALQQASQRLAAASDVERAYVEALSTRYSADPNADPKPLGAAYAAAMKALTTRFPDDLDAATLYAESLMNLKPWQLWSLDGKPADGTLEIVAVLESVLARAPDHVGANHYYIHAVEASTQPDRALPSAARLESLVPAAGHLVHMPSHIYQRTGDYRAAEKSNAIAAEVDRKYIATTGSGGLYPLMYYTHNLMFESAAASMAGRYAPALAAAKLTEQHLAPVLKDMPMAEAASVDVFLVMVRFQKWDDILAASGPAAQHAVATSLWRYARAAAFAGKGDAAKASAEIEGLAAARARIGKDAIVGLNPASTVTDLALLVATARVAEVKGDRAGAITLWRKAVAIQDTLAYDEPPDFHYPVRESLGGALLRAGQAREAEAVFREDLVQNRRNGRSLFGLWQSLERQGRSADAALVKQQYEAAWKDADTTLGVEQL